jgi:hypothetical protein
VLASLWRLETFVSRGGEHTKMYMLTNLGFVQVGDFTASCTDDMEIVKMKD